MLKKLLYAGISEDISDLDAKANYFKNRIIIIVAIVSLFFILQTYLNKPVEPHIKYRAYIFNGIPFILYCVALYLSFKRKHLIAKLILLTSTTCQIVTASLLVDSNFILYLLVICIIPFTIFIVEKKLRYTFSILNIVVLISVSTYFEVVSPQPLLPKGQLIVGFVTLVTVVPIVLVLIISDLQNTNIRIEKSLIKERRKSDDLLKNILPIKTSEEIKAGKKIIADDYPDASVLFADIVDFTNTTKNVSAKKVVNELNEFFCFVDDLVEEYDLEKIKTIGDAYMIASGLPEENSQHLETLIDFSLCLKEKVQELKFIDKEIKLRMGINSGPVVAGVLGKRKYIYDIWGETVNVASRMESNGLEGKIQISDKVYQRIKDKYICEKRGNTFIKGIGHVDTYFIVNKISPR